MLWLCIRLTQPGLAALACASDVSMPLVLTQSRAGRAFVFEANDAAVTSGICPGQPLTAAFALAPGLVVYQRQPPAEQALLERLAAWALQFTSRIHIDPPASLLLEIGGSLRLAGGLDRLTARIKQGLVTTGCKAVVSVAPVPTAARWLARAGVSDRVVNDPARLPQALGELPLDAVVEGDVLDALQAMGIRSMAQLFALPRDGLRRRFGRALIDELDRGLGRRPDALPIFEPPERFTVKVALPAEVVATDALRFTLRRLLMEMEGFLRGRAGAVDVLHLVFHARKASPLRIRVGLAAPASAAQRWLAVIEQRLERVQLSAPVVALELRSGRVQETSGTTADLFDAASGGGDIGRLQEQLVARLGEGAVCSLRLSADHRPEYAWRFVPPGSDVADATSGPHAAPRPLWLLSEPRKLVLRDGMPCHEGQPLVLECGPERIESGWWDGSDVCRDYYVARDASGARLWVYRERRQQGVWCLHGIFA